MGGIMIVIGLGLAVVIMTAAITASSTVPRGIAPSVQTLRPWRM